MTDRMRDIELRALRDLARILNETPPPPPPEPPVRLRQMRDRAYLRRLHDRRRHVNEEEAHDGP